jgi:hypothetical protein
VLETFTVDTFAPRLGEPFAVETEAGAVEVELVEATAHEPRRRGAPDGARVPFAIVFLGPPDPVLPQGMYRFEHADLDAFEIFVVPIAGDEDGVRYEAVFT